MGCWEMPSGQGMDPVEWISGGHSAMLDIIATEGLVSMVGMVGGGYPTEGLVGGG